MSDFQIYRWCGAEGGAEYGGVSEEDSRKIRWFDSMLGDPLPADVSDWKPPILTQYRGAGGKRELRPVGDSPSSAALNLISERAADALSEIWVRHATLYPVLLDDVPDEKYYMVAVKTVLDCLDRDSSTGPLQKYGPTPDLFATIHTWAFDEECVGDTDLFLTPDSKTTTFVSENFRKRVREARLTGFCLKREFWDQHPWISK